MEVLKRLVFNVPLVLKLIVVFVGCAIIFMFGDLILMGFRKLANYMNVNTQPIDVTVAMASPWAVNLILGGILVAIIIIVILAIREKES